MKPQTEDGINYELHGCTVRLLTMYDIMKEGDFIRDIYESPMYSQDGGWDTTYKNDKWQGPKWHKLEDEMPGWVGHTYQEFLKFCSEGEDWEPEDYYMGHEIVRVKTRTK